MSNGKRTQKNIYVNKKQKEHRKNAKNLCQGFEFVRRENMQNANTTDKKQTKIFENETKRSDWSRAF